MTTLEVLAERFGFTSFRPGQEHVIESLLAGRSALAVFPTGAGKSLCYQLPALLLDGVTVVVSPLIALMKDQIDLLARQGVDAARLDSSLDASEVRAVSERLRDGSLKLLYVAPERFNNERFLAQLGETKIALFAVDEAHCISEWGHNFRPDYLKLAARARELGAERVLALTATATPAVVADICEGFGIAEADAVVTGFYRPNLTLLTTPARASERDQLLIDRLRERAPGSTIVYVTLQRTAERVAVPERHLAGLAGGRGDQHLVVGDVLDAPRRCAQGEHVADPRLVDHLFVELADAPSCALSGREEHGVQPTVGDRATAGDSEPLRTRATGERARDAVPDDARSKLGELIAGIPPGQHVEH